MTNDHRRPVARLWKGDWPNRPCLGDHHVSMEGRKVRPAPHICASSGSNDPTHTTTRAFGSCFRPRFLNLMGLSVNEVTHHAPKATRGSSSNQVARTVTSPFGKLGVYVLRVEP